MTDTHPDSQFSVHPRLTEVADQVRAATQPATQAARHAATSPANAAASAGEAAVSAASELASEFPMSRPAFRGWLHAAGAVLAIPAGVVLLSGAGSAAAVASLAVFAVALTATFATSAIYHRAPMADATRLRWRRADHAMIFVLIAGTYTPICVLGLPPVWAVPALVVVWAAALGGAACKFFFFDTLGERATTLYGVLGWAGVVTVPALIASAPAQAVVLLFAGGVCYTAGAVVLARNSPNPAPATFGYHEVWHAATLVAASCHVVAVAALL